MQISEFAARVGETPRSIRFYESIGLLPDPEREPNDYRSYDDCDCERVRLIRTFKVAGFPLNEITRLLTIRDAEGRISADDLRFLARKQSEIGAHLHTVTDFRTELARLSYSKSDTQRSTSWPPAHANTNWTA